MPAPRGYRSAGEDPRSLRPASANRRAAFAVIVAIVIVVLLLALFT